MSNAAAPHLASVYGVDLSSNQPLPGLLPAGARDCCIHVAVNTDDAPADGARLWAPPGVKCSAAKAPSLQLWLSSECSDDDRVNWLCTSFVPALLASFGALVLRGAAVLSPAGAILLLGSAMSGKSSCAALLAKAGWPLITDDVVVLRRLSNQLCVTPGAPWIKLWPTTRALGEAVGRPFGDVRDGLSKIRYRLSDQSGLTGPIPVAGVCVLRGEAGDVSEYTPIAPTSLLEIVGMLQRPPALAPSSTAMGAQFAALCGLARLPNPGWINSVAAASAGADAQVRRLQSMIQSR